MNSLPQPLPVKEFPVADAKEIILGEVPTSIKGTFDKVILAYALSSGAKTEDFVIEGKVINLGRRDCNVLCKSFKESYWFEVEYQLKYLANIAQTVAHQMKQLGRIGKFNTTHISAGDVVCTTRLRIDGNQETVVHTDVPEPNVAR